MSLTEFLLVTIIGILIMVLYWEIRNINAKYRALLKKYMRHVDDEDGSDFVTYTVQGKAFSDVEWAELKKIAKEIIQEKK